MRIFLLQQETLEMEGLIKMENKEIIEKVLKEEEYLYNNNDEKMWIKKKWAKM